MTGAAVRTNERKRNQAFAPTWRPIGSRRRISRTSGDWRPGTNALAAKPAAMAMSATTPNAASATPMPAIGTSAAHTTADLAEHGVKIIRNDARSRSRRVSSTRVA